MDLDKSYINRLLYFYYVCTCKNITQAARETGLHQSALSRQMIKLEKEVGMKLLIRTSDGVSLTRKGEELFKSTGKIFMELNAGRKQLEEKEKISGKLRICSTYAMINYILSDPLLEFQQLNPDIEFEIIGNDNVVDIIKSNVDVVIRPYDFKTEGLIQEYIFSLQSKLYASTKYIEKNGFPESEKDLRKHKFIARSRLEMLPFLSSTINWFLNIEDVTGEKNAVLYTNIVETAFKAAKRGLGILPAYENMQILKGSDLVNVAPNVKGPLYKIYFTYPQHLVGVRKIYVLKNHLSKYFNINK